MKPSIDAYDAKEKTLQDDFGVLLKKHAVEDFECDPQCVTNCTNQEDVNFFELPDCLKLC